ncbi:MAG: 50S ribosomal protein L18 [Thermoanaerobaculia bacterium]|nr:50S ribosomal protein L18 [Thermoanaerobaculia bacterium]
MELRKKTKAKKARRERAHRRIRGSVNGTAARPRLAVFKSLKYIYAQVIDDRAGVTLASASSLEPSFRKGSTAGSNKEAAKLVGAAVAERALGKGVKQVVFDRGGYVYHGRIKELAEAAREKGLDF